MKKQDCLASVVSLPRRWIVFLLLSLGSSFAHANLFGNDPYDFDDDDRKQFQEAPDRFHKTILPHLIPYGGALWIDNQHVIMTVRELPDGWNANTMPVPVSPLSPTAYPKQGNSRIITVDVKTGEIQDALYSVGHLVCYADGKIVIEVASETGGSAEYYAGQYGSKLDKMEVARNRVPYLIGVGCTQIEVNDKFLVLHLLSQDGTLKVARNNFRDPGEITTLILSDRGDHLIATIPVASDAKPLGLRYLPYLNQYVAENIVSAATEHSGMLLSPDGKFSYIDSDPFLSTLAQVHQGSGGVVVTKVGLFWNFRPTPSYWKQQGLYFRENGKLLRLDDAGVGSLAVSPDGCKLFYDRTAGKYILNLARRSLVVMDLCEQKK